MFVVKRSKENPVLTPVRDRFWEASAVFNMSPVKKGRTIYGFYRAVSSKDSLQTPDQRSVIGVAKSQDGERFEDRRPFIEPVEEWEKFGCEDPRATLFEGRYYIFYTALSHFPFDADGIKVAVAISDDLKNVAERHLVTPFNAKAMALFPERVGGKVTAVFSAHTDSPPTKMCIVQADKIEDFWSPVFWKKWYAEIDSHTIDLRRSGEQHTEVGAVPIKTDRGWLMVYSHIENYFGGGRPKFGIEAVLLDSEDPRKIVGRTTGPILVPEEPYEISGYVPNIVFPSGAIVEKGILNIYYGGADTTVCVARVALDDLVSSIHQDSRASWRFKRFEGNPTISPISTHSWESQGTFNPAAIDLKGKVHIIYRALSGDNTSTLGYASSKDGFNIDERLPDPIYLPHEDFENKKVEGGNSGCEDPRLSKLGKTIYMCYTAFDGVGPPRVAVTSIEEKNFLARKWNWSQPELITPKGVDDKDTCILDEKIGGKYLVIHRIGTDICGDYLKSLDFKKESINKCIRIFGPRHGMWDGWKIGISAPPVKTKSGWILLYHGVSENHHYYRVGAVLLDPKDPTVVLARSADPIFEPEEQYEKEGVVPNVVFPCGMVVRDGKLFIYYGGADKVCGVATMDLAILENALVKAIGF